MQPEDLNVALAVDGRRENNPSANFLKAPSRPLPSPAQGRPPARAGAPPSPSAPTAAPGGCAAATPTPKGRGAPPAPLPEPQHSAAQEPARCEDGCQRPGGEDQG